MSGGKSLIWNGIKFSTIKELSDYAGFNQSQYFKFAAALKRCDYDVDRALGIIYSDSGIDDEFIERDRKDLVREELLDKFPELCKKYKIKNKESFYNYLSYHADLKLALDDYHNNLKISDDSNEDIDSITSNKFSTSSEELKACNTAYYKECEFCKYSKRRYKIIHKPMSEDSIKFCEECDIPMEFKICHSYRLDRILGIIHISDVESAYHTYSFREDLLKTIGYPKLRKIFDGLNWYSSESLTIARRILNLNIFRIWDIKESIGLNEHEALVLVWAIVITASKKQDLIINII